MKKQLYILFVAISSVVLLSLAGCETSTIVSPNEANEAPVPTFAKITTVQTAASVNKSAEFLVPSIAGNFLVVGINWPYDASITTVTDNKNQTWKQAIASKGYNDSNQQIWYVENAIAGVNSIIVSFSGFAGSVRMIANEYAGISPTDALISSSFSDHDKGFRVTNFSSGTATLSAESALAVGFTTSYYGGTAIWTAGNGFIQQGQTTDTNAMWQDKVITQTENKASAGTVSAGGINASLVLFRAAVSGTTVPPPTLPPPTTPPPTTPPPTTPPPTTPPPTTPPPTTPPPTTPPPTTPPPAEPPPPFTIEPDLSSLAGSGAPVILFTDVEYGPNTSGPNNLGVPIALFGKGFGALRGNSKVTIGGVEVGSYMVWGEKNAHNTTLDMIVVQPGANVGSGPIQVIVNDVNSNNNFNFTSVARKIYYISATGSNSAACSEVAPCATISHVVGIVMRPGDTVLVRGGSYPESEIYIRPSMGGTTTAPKTIKRYPGEEPNLTNAARPLIIDADYVTLSGFNFKNGKSTGAAGWSNRHQSGVKIIDNTFIGIIAYDAITSHGDNHVYAGNVCKVDGSSQSTQGHCYYISDGSNIKLLYNVGSGAPGYAIHIYDQRRRDTGDFQRIIKNVLIEGNILFASPERSGLLISMDDEANLGNYISDITIRNNIFTGNNFVGVTLQNNLSNVKVYNNTFYENGTQSLFIGTAGTVAPKNVDVYNNLFYQTNVGYAPTPGSNGVCRRNCSWYTPAHIAVDTRAQNVTVHGNYYGPGAPVAVNTQSSGSPIPNPDTAPITGAITFANPAQFNFRINESIFSGIGAY